MALARERDVGEANQLLVQAQQRGSIRLPELTDTDLCVFSDSFATLADEQVWQTWCQLPEQERDALAATARDFLVHRRLLRPLAPDDRGGEQFAIQPKLGYILAARQQPGVLGVCSVPGQLRVGDLRMFVLVDETRPDPIVVLERTTARGLAAFGRIREYALATPEAAGCAAADWVRQSLDADPGAAGQPRTIDFYRHFEDEPLTAERFSLDTDDGRLTLTHLRDNAIVAENQPIEQRELAAQVALALRGVQR